MQRARVSLSIGFHRPEGPQNSSLPNSERDPGSQGPGQEAAAVAGPKERGGEAESGESEPRYQHCPSSPLPLFERITSCYCVQRMHGGVSDPSFCVFIHRVAFEEVSGHRVLMKSGPGYR